jgi:hypothetical protein
VEDGFNSNCQEHNCKCWNICQHPVNHCQNEDGSFLDTSALGMKRGSTTMVQRGNTEVLNGNIYNCQWK